MSKSKRTRKQPTTLEDIIARESKEWYENQPKEYKEALQQLSETEDRERVERYLKNEAYAFLLAEGLLDKFLEFRETFHRTKPQEALFSLVAEADMGGLWIDM